MKKEEINEFILRIFNYYNGRINMEIMAGINISYNNSKHNVGGLTKAPNLVTIYPVNIMEVCENNIEDFKLITTESIIHELYHVDQFIGYSMLDNTQYRNSVENNVEFMTISYILNHTNELYNLFGISIPNNYKIYYTNKLPESIDPINSMYNRVNEFSHIFRTLDSILLNKDLSNKMIDYLIKYANIKNSKIIIEVNNNSIIIKDCTQYIDINEFNIFMTNNVFKYDSYEVSNDGGCYISGYDENNNPVLKVQFNIFDQIREMGYRVANKTIYNSIYK